MEQSLESKDRLVLTACAPGSVSVGGAPSHLHTLMEWVRSGDAGIEARCSSLKIFSPYHHRDLLQNAFDQVMRDVERRRISLIADHKKLNRNLLDITNAETMDRNVTASDLTRRLVEANLFDCNRFDLLAEALARTAQNFANVAIYTAAPTISLATAIHEAVTGSPDHVAINCAIFDLSKTSDSVDKPLFQFISPETEEVAIIAMSCRLPGGVRSPEQAWEFMKAGKSGIAEVSTIV